MKLVLWYGFGPLAVLVIEFFTGSLSDIEGTREWYVGELRAALDRKKGLSVYYPEFGYPFVYFTTDYTSGLPEFGMSLGCIIDYEKPYARFCAGYNAMTLKLLEQGVGPPNFLRYSKAEYLAMSRFEDPGPYTRTTSLLGPGENCITSWPNGRTFFVDIKERAEGAWVRRFFDYTDKGRWFLYIDAGATGEADARPNNVLNSRGVALAIGDGGGAYLHVVPGHPRFVVVEIESIGGDHDLVGVYDLEANGWITLFS